MTILGTSSARTVGLPPAGMADAEARTESAARSGKSGKRSAQVVSVDGARPPSGLAAIAQVDGTAGRSVAPRARLEERVSSAHRTPDPPAVTGRHQLSRELGIEAVGQSSRPVEAARTWVERHFPGQIPAGDLREVLVVTVGSSLMAGPAKHDARIENFKMVVGKLGGAGMSSDQAQVLTGLIATSRLAPADKQAMVSHLAQVVGGTRFGEQSPLHRALAQGLPAPGFLSRFRFNPDPGLLATYKAEVRSATTQRKSATLASADMAIGRDRANRLEGIWNDGLRSGTNISATRAATAALARDMLASGLQPHVVLTVCVNSFGKTPRIHGGAIADGQHDQAVRGMTQGLCDSLGVDTLRLYMPRIARDLGVERDAKPLSWIRSMAKEVGRAAAFEAAQAAGRTQVKNPDWSVIPARAGYDLAARLDLIAAFAAGRADGEMEISRQARSQG